MDTSDFPSIAGRFAAQRILIIGDLMLDEFIWGKVSRISPEAPVPVVNVTEERPYPGGAANVARNVREFTAHTAVMGMVGADSAGDQLLSLLDQAGIDTAGVQRDPGCSTVRKTRIIARNQQVVRVDRERRCALTAEQNQQAIRHLDAIAGRIDGIIVADYGKGFLSQSLATHICEWASRNRKILTVDPHPHTLLDWRGATAVKPNRSEAFLAAALPHSDPVEPVLADRALLEAGARLLSRWKTGSLLITLGDQGMLLLQPGSDPYHVPTRARSVFDVSGAGDTAIAVFTLALCAGATPMRAAEIANHASGIVVGKLGTATVTADELQAGLQHS
jgi:D-beta-D-heptose 7-phosphate kinase/D-beta-D-heptose 1-phosphate adenosyltransferase